MMYAINAAVQGLVQSVIDIKAALPPQPGRASGQASLDPTANADSNTAATPVVDNHPLPGSSGPSAANEVRETRKEVQEIRARLDSLGPRGSLSDLGIRQSNPAEWRDVPYPPKYKPFYINSFDEKFSARRFMSYFEITTGHLPPMTLSSLGSLSGHYLVWPSTGTVVSKISASSLLKTSNACSSRDSKKSEVT